jgi:hypothetical protein
LGTFYKEWDLTEAGKWLYTVLSTGDNAVSYSGSLLAIAALTP